MMFYWHINGSSARKVKIAFGTAAGRTQVPSGKEAQHA
jgi:hypothetical protein